MAYNDTATVVLMSSHNNDICIQNAGWWITAVMPVLMSLLYLFNQRQQLMDYFRKPADKQSSTAKLTNVHQSINQNVSISKDLLDKLASVTSELATVRGSIQAISERSSQLNTSEVSNPTPPPATSPV